MHWSRTLLPTMRETPADARGLAEGLLARAGLVRRTGAGALAYLPLGSRVVQKLSALIRAAMTDAGADEILLGSDAADVAAADLAARTVTSHKQLPVAWFRMTSNPAGAPTLFGNSFHGNAADLDGHAGQMTNVFAELLGLLSIRYITAQSDGGSRFACPSPDGTAGIFLDERGDYAADADIAQTGDRPWAFAGAPLSDLEKVHTPGLASVAEVAVFLKVPANQILKTIIFQATSAIPVHWVVAVVRGDHQVNVWKLAQAAQSLGVTSLRLVDSPQVREKFAIGYVDPDAGTNTPDAVLIVDPDAAQGEIAWAAGANEANYHVRNFSWFRDAGDRLADPAKVLVADIRNAIENDPSPTPGGGALHRRSAIDLGQIRSLGAALCAERGATFDDGGGSRRPLVVGAYSLSLANILQAVIEHSHDENGILWPAAIAPMSVVLTPIKYEGEAKQAADRLYTQLTFEGIDTLLDDRDARAGSKFADADLVGFPIRINIGNKHLAEGHVELKRRAASDVELVSIKHVVPRIRGALAL